MPHILARTVKFFHFAATNLKFIWSWNFANETQMSESTILTLNTDTDIHQVVQFRDTSKLKIPAKPHHLVLLSSTLTSASVIVRPTNLNQLMR